MRRYDLGNIKQQELDRLSFNLTALKDKWQKIKASLQEKVNFVNGISTKHKQEVNLYMEFSEYLDAKKLEGKMKDNLSEFSKKQAQIMEPVRNLREQRDWMLA